MKRIMEEAVAQNTETIHYSMSAGICVGGEMGATSGSNTGFWPPVLEGLMGVRLQKEEATAWRGGSKSAPYGMIQGKRKLALRKPCARTMRSS